MKNKYMRFVSSAVLSVMLFCILTFASGINIVHAENIVDGCKFSELDDGTVMITKYKGDEQKVVIPSEINGKKVTAIGDGAFPGYRRVSEVVFPDSITKIGVGAFQGCTALTEITIPSSVEKLGSQAFAYCNRLKTINLPDNLINLGYSVFESTQWYQDQLKTAYQHGESIYIGKIFYEFHCSEEDSDNTRFEIKDGTVAIAGGAFAKTSNLETVIIPEGVTLIGEKAFFQHRNLKSIKLPTSLTKIEKSAFEDCDGLETVEYAGTKEQFDSIEMGEYERRLLSACMKQTAESTVVSSQSAPDAAVTESKSFDPKVLIIVIAGVFVLAGAAVLIIFALKRKNEENSSADASDKNNKHEFRILRAVIPASIILVVVAAVAVLIICMPDSAVGSMSSGVEGSSSRSGEASSGETEKGADTPIKIMLKDNVLDVDGRYHVMKAKTEVSIKTVSTPFFGYKSNGSYDGVRLWVSCPGKRIDASADNGRFEKANGCYSETYCCNYDTLEMMWRPYGVYDFWADKAEIRITAWDGNKLSMLAVISIKSPNNIEYTAEVTEYKDFSDVGGIEITDENSSEYFPGDFSFLSTYDLNDIIDGKEPTITKLHLLQPYCMKVRKTEGQPDSPAVRLAYSIPMIIDSNENKISIGNSANSTVKFPLYTLDPFEKKTFEELTQYIEDPTNITPKYFEGSKKTLFVPNQKKVFPTNGIMHTFQFLNHSADSSDDNQLTELEQLTVFDLKREGGEDEVLVTVIDRYLDLSAPDTSLEYKDLSITPYDRRMESLNKHTGFTDEEMKQKFSIAYSQAKEIDPDLTEDEFRESYRENNYRYGVDGAEGYLNEFPYLSDEKIMQISVMRTPGLNSGGYLYRSPWQEALIAGLADENTPRLTKADVERIAAEVNDEAKQTKLVTDQQRFEFYDIVYEKFISAVICEDYYFNPDSGKHSDERDPEYRLLRRYNLADGGCANLSIWRERTSDGRAWDSITIDYQPDSKDNSNVEVLFDSDNY